MERTAKKRADDGGCIATSMLRGGSENSDRCLSCNTRNLKV